MSVITCNATLPNTSQKTDFYNLVNTATVSSIQGTDIASGANIPNTALATITQAGLVNTSALTGQIANSNLAQLVNAALVSGAALTLLTNIPSGAGIIPQANVGGLWGSYVSKTPGQIYQALTDGFVIAFNNANNTNGYVAPTTPPSSGSPGNIQAFNASGSASCCGFPVPKNYYYEISGSGADMWFIPLGS